MKKKFYHLGARLLNLLFSRYCVFPLELPHLRPYFVNAMVSLVVRADFSDNYLFEYAISTKSL